MQFRLLLILLLTPFLAAPIQAGIFGRKKEKVETKSRLPELLGTLLSDGDADKRARAAEELRNYDAGANPEISSILIQVLQNDKVANVRAEAATSLGKIRPVTQAAGEALEQAMANDESPRVRLLARSALLNYHWAGYRSEKKTEVPPITPPSKEPPAVSTMTPTLPPAAAPTLPPATAPTLSPTTSQVVPTSATPITQPQPQPPTRSRLLPFLRSPFRSNQNTTPNVVPNAAPIPRSSTKEPPLAPPLDAPVTLPPAVTTKPNRSTVESGPDLP